MGIASSLFTFAAALALAVPVMAHTATYTTPLSGGAEAPPNASPGTGWATVIIDDHNYTMQVIASFSGLLGNVTAAHIHCCTAAAGAGTAGVATITPTFPGFPSGVNAGSYDQTFNMLDASSWNANFITAAGGTPVQAFSLLLSGLDAGKSYFNIHTSSFPPGEIRGFLAPVPEPATYALMLGGLALLGCAARRRRQAG